MGRTYLIHGATFVALLLPGIAVSLYVGKGHVHDSLATAAVVWISFAAAIVYIIWFHLFVWRCPSCKANLGRDLGNYCSNCGADLRQHQ